MLILVNFCTFLKTEIYQNQKSRASKTAKMADFELLDSPKLISRKNLVGSKFVKFPHCVFENVDHMV